MMVSTFNPPSTSSGPMELASEPMEMPKMSLLQALLELPKTSLPSAFGFLVPKETPKKRKLEDTNWSVEEDESIRPDKTRRHIMSHDEIVQASYGLQIPYFQKFFIHEPQRPTMSKLARRARQSLELRRKIGPIYETSTPKNSTTPMFFDFGPCPWMLDVKNTPKLDAARENRRFIEKTERIKAQQQQEQAHFERVTYGERLMSAVMIKAELYGGLQAYLKTLGQDEQLHILQTMTFLNETQQAAQAQQMAKAARSGR